MVVQPICLPDPSVDYDDNVTALLTGWGRTNSTGPQSEELQEVAVKTMTNQDCARSHGDNKITDSMICAEGAGKDACKGRSHLIGLGLVQTFRPRPFLDPSEFFKGHQVIKALKRPKKRI